LHFATQFRLADRAASCLRRALGFFANASQNQEGLFMRRWHRWISLVFAVSLLWIAATGVASQIAANWPAGESEKAAAAAVPPAGFECPQGWRCLPPRPKEGMRGLVGTLHHLHSGETFGPAGTAISLASGLGLLFFDFSGLWMYLRRWRERARRGARARWFWK
jgi:uncharacterized iron-regulated membrane protein